MASTTKPPEGFGQPPESFQSQPRPSGARTPRKVSSIGRPGTTEYGRKPQMKVGSPTEIDDYKSMMRPGTDRLREWSGFDFPHSALKKPYQEKGDEYPEMEHARFRSGEPPYYEPPDEPPPEDAPPTVPGEPDECAGRHISLSSGPGLLYCGEVHRFYPVSGVPPFAFELIVPGDVEVGSLSPSGVFTAAECGLSCNTSDRVIVRMSDACTPFGGGVSDAIFSVRQNSPGGGDLPFEILENTCGSETPGDCTITPAGESANIFRATVFGQPPIELWVSDDNGATWNQVGSYSEQDITDNCPTAPCVDGSAQFRDACGRVSGPFSTVSTSTLEVTGPDECDPGPCAYGATGGSAPYSFSLVGAATATISGAGSLSVNGDCGCVTVVVTDDDGCTAAKNVRLPGAWFFQDSVGGPLASGFPCSGSNSNIYTVGAIQYRTEEDSCTNNPNAVDGCAGSPADCGSWNCPNGHNAECQFKVSTVRTYHWGCT